MSSKIRIENNNFFIDNKVEFFEISDMRCNEEADEMPVKNQNTLRVYCNKKGKSGNTYNIQLRSDKQVATMSYVPASAILILAEFIKADEGSDKKYE